MNEHMNEAEEALTPLHGEDVPGAVTAEVACLNGQFDHPETEQFRVMPCCHQEAK